MTPNTAIAAMTGRRGLCTLVLVLLFQGHELLSPLCQHYSTTLSTKYYTILIPQMLAHPLSEPNVRSSAHGPFWRDYGNTDYQPSSVAQQALWRLVMEVT